MSQKFYLMSGHSSTGELKDIDKQALSCADNGHVLVLNLSQIDMHKSFYFVGLKKDEQNFAQDSLYTFHITTIIRIKINYKQSFLQLQFVLDKLLHNDVFPLL